MQQLLEPEKTKDKLHTVEREARTLIVEYLQRELVGPLGGPEEVLEGEPPHKRYTLGVLFPQDADTDKALEDEEEETQGASTSDLLADDPVTLAGQWMPSSIGLSFYFTGEPEIVVALYGAKYQKEKSAKGAWIRKPVASEEVPEEVRITRLLGKSRTERPVLDGAANLNINWRSLGAGYLVTVTLVNTASGDRAEIQGEECLCQVGFRCRVTSGIISEYPSVNLRTADEEEQELQLLYRRNKVYAIGHGCAAEWSTDEHVPSYVKTQVMPSAYVPDMTHNLEDDPEILRISRIADEAVSKSVIIGELEEFVNLYKKWIDRILEQQTDIPQRLKGAKDRVSSRLMKAYERMQKGVAYLADSKNEKDWQSFRLANLAMLMQMRHGAKDLGGSTYSRNHSCTERQNYLALPYKWRPFQLAFQLLTVESTGNEDSVDRNTVDLIWFPTGGGKTEAYLAVAAFEIFRRRLKYRERGLGTAVITRYTLRLLTSQQFQRAARLISACEIIRRGNPSDLGYTPITIGFWAGDAASPNSSKDALDRLKKVREHSDPSENNPFQIESCPWCGTELLPKSLTEDADSYGFRFDNETLITYCTTEDCDFHSQIPVSVVDDDLYANPPSFLIATVDKFARLAWVAEAGAFFGKGKVLPPSLIIQDELHLLSGPLGTTVGLYESAVEALIEFHGLKPKIVASTATIRSAGDQVNGLFGRDVALFPPSGLTADDSYFAKVDTTKKGRLYVGVMSSNHRATTSAVRTAAALQQAIVEIDELTDEEKDAYWTLVMYHLSLRELGKTVSFARDDIPARIKIIASSEDKAREIYDDDVLELTSNLSASQIPASLARMKKHYTDVDSVALLACTNMLSVGVDVGRLGIMMVNGQPKTTSEYIQASSRVGRDIVPGLVVAHYAATKPRDRSHYESFQPYHSSLYRYVEPASVTPFSLPARNRALHAVLVILMRHGVGLKSNKDAQNFRMNDIRVIQAIELLKKQAAIKDPQESENTIAHLERLITEWDSLAKEGGNGGAPLCYSDRGKQVRSLLKDFNEKGSGWPTLNSMRSVDAECLITVLN